MAENAPRLILSIAEVGRAAIIDFGNTLAVNLGSAEEREIVLVIPYGVADAMAEELASGLDHAARVREQWGGLRIGGTTT